MAALLAGARLLLRHGLRSLPTYSVRTAAVPVRCLSRSARFFTTAVQDENAVKDEASQSNAAWLSPSLRLHNIGVNLKATGRIGKQRFLNVFEDLCREGSVSGDQSWFFLQTCGSAMPEVPPAERTEIAQNVWKKLQELGVVLTLDHYNILLKIYLENEHEFAPMEFLADMEAAQVQPNQVTYERLLAAYCNQGDVEGARKILGFLKKNNFPVTEHIFSSLIRGHARSGDMESAENILSVMKEVGLEPGNQTYAALLCAYAEKGDIQSIAQTLPCCNNSTKNVMCLKVIYSLTKNGHSQFVPEIFKSMTTGCNQEATNLCLNLLAQGYGDMALQVAKRLISLEGAETFASQPGSFFLRHCVVSNMPIDMIKKYAAEIKESNMHQSPLQFALHCALRDGKKDMALELIRTLKEEDLPVRPHYVWPLLTSSQNETHVQGALQVLKKLQEMDVRLDLDTFSLYIAPLSKDAEYAKSILQESGFQENFNEIYRSALKEGMGSGRMRLVYNLLSKFPLVMNRSVSRTYKNNFFRCNDPKRNAEITKLLYPDDSSLQEPSSGTESVGRFLCRLIGSMSDSDIEAKEEYLKQYLLQLKEMGVTLDSREAPKLSMILKSQSGLALVEEIKKWTDSAVDSDVAKDVSHLEEKLEMERANNLPCFPTLFLLLEEVIKAKDVDKVLEITSKHNRVFSFAMYMKVLGFLCKNNSPHEALKLKEEVNRRGFFEVSSIQKYLQLLKVLALNGCIEDAINILKEMQEKDVAVDSVSIETFIYILNGLALKGDAEGINRLFENIIILGLTKPTARLCSPMVRVHLNRNDCLAAYNAMVDCQMKYGFSVLEDILLVKLIKNEETDLLKNTVDFLGKAMGERLMLHNLMFAFIESGKYEEAQKIAETPGLRAVQKNINWYTERYRKRNMGYVLEKCLEITRVLYGIDRDELYYQLLWLYDQNNECDKAIALWHKMKEEGFRVRKRTTDLYKNIMRKNEKDISAYITESEQESSDAESSDAESSDINKRSKLMVGFCKNQKIKDAYSLFLETKDYKKPLTKTAYARLIRILLNNSLIEDALKVEAVAQSHYSDYRLNNVSNNLHLAKQVKQDCLKDALVTTEKMIRDHVMPSHVTLNKLTTAFARKGDIDGLQTLEKIINNGHFVYSRLDAQFSNCKILAHFKNGNSEEALALFESKCTNKPWESHYTSYMFVQLMVHKMFDDLEKVSIVAERLANQFSIYYPVTELFLSYVKFGHVEEAKQLLQRCQAIVEQTEIIKTHIARYVRKNTVYVYQLIDILGDIDPFYKEFGYRHLMKHYTITRELHSAVAMYEKIKAEQIEPDGACLKQLAVLLREAGQPVPFLEPQDCAESSSEEQSPSAEKL